MALKKTSVIEQKIYRKVDLISQLYIKGWALHSDGTAIEAFHVLLNGKQVPFEIAIQSRQDVVLNFPKENISIKCGFVIVVDCKEDDIQSFCIEGDDKVLLQLDQSQIQSILDNNPIEYRIDGITIDDNTDEVVLSGWAYSFDKEVLDVALLDQNGNEVSCQMQRLNRLDLVQLKIVSQESSFCGFQIRFIREKGLSYTLSLSTSKYSRKVEVNLSMLALQKKLGQRLQIFNRTNILKGKAYLKKYGIKKTLAKLRQGSHDVAIRYPLWFKEQQISSDALLKQKEHTFNYSPKISLIVATYNTKESYLKEMIDSVMDQSYSNWELCIADGSTNDRVEEYVSKHYGTDSRIKFKRLDKNYGISGNSNEALTLVTGDYVGFYDHDDFLELDLLYEVVSSLQDVRHDIVYTDEDKFDDARKQFTDPNFKPDFSIDLFRSHNYITHFFCVKKSILDEVGGFISEYDGAQDYDIMFRCIEKSKSIHHIHRILYHWRMHPLSTAQDPESKLYCYEAGKKAIESHLSRIGVKARVEMMPKPFWGMYHVIYETVGNPLVSIIIPNMNHKDVLKTCIDSLFHVNTYKNFEIVIVENNSTEKEIFDYYDQLQNNHSNVRVVKWEKAFNYSLINNFGVEHAKGEYLLFLNNDTEVISPTAISEMLGHCMREEVGAVGAKLLYADDTVQHAGVVIGFSGYAGHIFCGDSKDDYGYMCRAQINCNYSAVTAACLMTRREIFDQVHGFDPDFKVAGNDVDFCLKIRQLNKFITFNAFSLWHHYESKSRGYEDTPEKIQRFNNEVLRFQKKWPDILENGDPFYNKNFDINLGAFKLN